MRRRLPWLLLGTWALLNAVSSTLKWRQGDTLEALIPLALAVLAGVGAVLASRRSENPIGWLLLGVALLVALSDLATAVYSQYENDPGYPLVIRLLVWFDNWVLHVWIALIGLALPLLFPEGRLPSRRLKRLAWAGAAALVLAVLGIAFGEPRLEIGDRATVANPLALGAAAGSALASAGTVGQGGLDLMMLAALAGVGVRLRRSTGVERQQLKWFSFAIALLLLGLAAATLGTVAELDALGFAGWMAFLFSVIVALPLAIGVAILRYRLYDIDLVINRALVYGGLTIALGATYLALVLLAGLAVGDSGLAVAVSTLAVAALIRPARARIQAAVDHRFYRRRYDAARTLEGFAARLRDEIDLETLAGDVRGVVRETVQPGHVSLWLRGTR